MEGVTSPDYSIGWLRRFTEICVSCVFWLAQLQCNFPYHQFNPSDHLDELLIEDLKEGFCHLDLVCRSLCTEEIPQLAIYNHRLLLVWKLWSFKLINPSSRLHSMSSCWGIRWFWHQWWITVTMVTVTMVISNAIPGYILSWGIYVTRGTTDERTANTISR